MPANEGEWLKSANARAIYLSSKGDYLDGWLAGVTGGDIPQRKDANELFRAGLRHGLAMRQLAESLAERRGKDEADRYKANTTLPEPEQEASPTVVGE